MHRIVTLVFVVAMVLAGCGDSGGTPSTPGASTPAPTDAATSTTQTDASLPPSDGSTDLLGNEAGTGFVEIDGTRHEFIANAACQKIFGAVQAAGPLTTGEGNFDAIIPPEDWESEEQAAFEWDPPYVSIDIDDVDWRADPTMEYWNGSAYVAVTPQESSVTSFSNDGSTVSGEATFAYYDAAAGELQTAAGTFAFSCP